VQRKVEMLEGDEKFTEKMLNDHNKFIWGLQWKINRNEDLNIARFTTAHKRIDLLKDKVETQGK